LFFSSSRFFNVTLPELIVVVSYLLVTSSIMTFASGQ
jgi:hypothetical protein